MSMAIEKVKMRCNSKLSYVDCCMRLMGDTNFNSMSNDDLDALYFVAYKRWAFHQTRESLIKSLNQYVNNKNK